MKKNKFIIYNFNKKALRPINKYQTVMAKPPLYYSIPRLKHFFFSFYLFNLTFLFFVFVFLEQ